MRLEKNAYRQYFDNYQKAKSNNVFTIKREPPHLPETISNISPFSNEKLKKLTQKQVRVNQVDMKLVGKDHPKHTQEMTPRQELILRKMKFSN
mmetsp:Transcript_23790/g.23486  ORF Transcript_23790/g.23486 Transcript_23790/m.23486 type:complete len:93 (+) Transcript_23790:872-1150(+)